MIILNGKPVEIGSFPDGTILMKEDSVYYSAYGSTIIWKYENDREFLALIYLVKHLRRRSFNKISLWMPYIPNARMDRVKHNEDVFTLKYFTEIFNDLHFDSVTVLDPHSSVSEALIDNLNVINPKIYGLCGKTDEDNLGFSYDTLDRYLRTGICEDVEAKMKIDKLHNKNLFKMKPIPSFHYDQRLLMDILP